MSKSAKIVLSKSILDVKKNLSKSINLGDRYLSKTFFSKLNFWTTLLSKITPNFWQTVITRRNFLKIFPWWHVDSWSKSLLVRTHHLWNSTTELILVCICLCFHFKYKTCCPKYFLWPEFGQKMSKSTSKQVQMHHVEVLPVFLFIHIFNMK